ncbi:hypothetical protein OE88DRAFT_706636 [Heliocybe sulcata]|uniref:Pentacotripeptide-repeat region of PRORP domain-containing protein n=1 Tax=Heliocybe sulcata TaxID=5364 RepID=A0A5C3NIZ8_9AGAM|nr:hypothetical protein OE88DRAFT_706636 [Heliocybe sulcata]
MWDLVRARVAARRPRLTTSSRSSSAWAWRVPFSHTNELADNPSDASSPAAASTPRRTPTYKVTDFPVESEPNPTDVWDRYAELVATEGPENIAPAVHRVALRKSVPDRRMIRLGAPGMKRVVYENRMRAVVQNMDRAGSQASLDDYHFILTQFAAGGHCMGSRQVLADMIESGVEPTATTFGLVMQAIAHRLFIARRPEQRPGIIHMTKRVLDEVLEKMSTRGVPWTSANMDLAIRILRETTDRQGYEKLLRVAYGVDIRNPDRLALEYAQTPKDAESGPLQLSTAALNTTIDTLGHIAPTSQLVAMFEALTTPLPASRPQPSYALEEDEEDFGVPPDSQTVGRPPCATPNTATYTILMQHLTYHKTLLRHYMLQVMQAEHDVDRRVCGLINRGVALGEIPAHHVAVNRDMISAVWSQASSPQEERPLSVLQRPLVQDASPAGTRCPHPIAIRRQRSYTFCHSAILARFPTALFLFGASEVPPSEDAPVGPRARYQRDRGPGAQGGRGNSALGRGGAGAARRAGGEAARGVCFVGRSASGGVAGAVEDDCGESG